MTGKQLLILGGLGGGILWLANRKPTAPMGTTPALGDASAGRVAIGTPVRGPDGLTYPAIPISMTDAGRPVGSIVALSSAPGWPSGGYFVVTPG